MEQGHVFVVQSRLESYHWDAVVIPTSGKFGIRPYWRKVVRGDVEKHKPDGWTWGASGQSREDRRIWFLDVTGGAEALELALTDLLRKIVANLSGESALSNTWPRIAMPVLGVGGGGMGAQRGRMVRILDDVAHRLVSENPVDVVVSAISESDYAAIQADRRKRHPSDDSLDAQAKQLALQAQQGHLALFLGAGASISAGLPSWSGLLDVISGGRQDVHDLDDPLDQGELLRRQLHGGLGDAVADATDSGGKHALAHALLASLRCREVVTTNFDECYELAAERDGITVLPWSRTEGDKPWLLKMHGSRHKPKSIVLSRRDFVQFHGKSGPSGAVLQAVLMTKHLLVVGASFTDSNLLRLVHEVAAFRDEHEIIGPMGTIVTLHADRSRQLLLEGDFTYLSMAESDEEVDDRTAARRLEIFLDSVAMYAASSSPYLLDPRYVNLHRSADETQVAAELRSLLPRVRALAAESPAWHDVADELEAWGAAEKL